jgi:hypothetical protein
VSVEEGRGAGPGRSNLDEGIAIFGFVIEDTVAIDDGRGEHPLQFLERVGPVCAQLIEEDDPVAGMIAEMIEQPGDETFIGCGAREVGERNADPVGGSYAFAKGCGTDGIPENVLNGTLLILKARLVGGLDDRSAIGGEVDGEVGLAVGELDVHSDTICFDAV